MTNRESRRTVVRTALAGAILGSAWLLLAAVPALADGGPHVTAKNSGYGTGSTLVSDNCAACHRAHTARGFNLVNANTADELCLSCHGSSGTGATTNVANGVQFALGSGTVRGGSPAGALRGGGFLTARIDTSHPSRVMYASVLLGTLGSAQVPVLSSGQATTSAHIAINPSLVVKGVAWGNDGTGAGQPLALECVTCHNPHGNGQYRILVPIPGDGTGPLVEETSAANVTDATLPVAAGAAGVRNYTIMWGRTLADVVNGTYPGGGTGSTGGDYFRRYLPWNAVPGSGLSGIQGDRPMYVPGNSYGSSYRAQITLWCSSCHTRYDRLTGADVDTGDPIFRYRHYVGNVECTVCHVAHGSNAQMTGSSSGSFPYPDDIVNSGSHSDTSPSSRLLKIDNRGTCQACHDPTHTVPAGAISTPAP